MWKWNFTSPDEPVQGSLLNTMVSNKTEIYISMFYKYCKKHIFNKFTILDEMRYEGKIREKYF